ncbi:multidrug transporter [Kwoniella heveanensis BCC8398]|uniref:Multidrug transporter n=1 Tax=Kwoniella heveanensis BCC8398 TaxID=1296120 RepID=A0A1B9GLL7_9TREE|nr:multidrug transporter [Kwoniella heveanensis BCC8398]
MYDHDHELDHDTDVEADADGPQKYLARVTKEKGSATDVLNADHGGPSRPPSMREGEGDYGRITPESPISIKSRPLSSAPSSRPSQPSARPTLPHAQVSHFAYPGRGTPDEPFLVDFGPEDRTNPYNWSKKYRWFLTLLIGVTALCPPFASVSYSSTVAQVSKEFGMSSELATAGISLYILGNAIGVLFWAPLSEIYGRQLAFNASFPLFTISNLGTALAKNTRTLMVMRFFAGLFGASCLTNAGGQIGDMWAAHERAMATSIFSLAPFLGPVLGPIIGGYVTEYCGYHWVYWLQFIYAFVITAICLVVQPETYAPTILRRQANKFTKLSFKQGSNEVYIAKYDKVKKSKSEIMKIGLLRPFELLFTEVIVGCLAIYGAIVYGILYLFFACFPLIYQEIRGWSVGQGGLAFLGMGLGLIVGNAINPLGNYWYRRASIPGQSTPPEARLPLAFAAAILCPVGLFWFAWTSAPPVHWIWSILASIPFGLAFILIFSAMVNYIIDSYTLYAASALAAQAVLRCLFGAAFPLFAVKMYRDLGLHWAGTLVAFLSLICAPMPFLFYRYGPYLRRKSRYAPSVPLTQAEIEASSETPEQLEAEAARDELRKVETRLNEDEALEPQWGAEAGERAKQGGEGVREVDMIVGLDLEKGRQ